MVKQAYSLVVFALVAVGASAHEAATSAPWSLEECIAHALDHNITIKQQDLQVRQQEIQLNSALNSRLPGVSANAGENLSFGRGLTADNTYSNTNTTSTSFNIGASVPVFQGFRIRNSIKLGELNLEAAVADLESTKDNISVAVAQSYLQILYSDEILGVARNQVAIDSAQLVRLSALADNGKASKAEVAQQKAALGQSKLAVTQASNNLKTALLDLSQLLELPGSEGFDVVKPSFGDETALVPLVEDVYADALGAMAVVRAQELRLDASEFSILNAKAAFLPSISLSGGLGTNFYTMTSGVSASFSNQIKNNFSQYLGLSLNIPIFNSFQTRNQVRSAVLMRESQSLALENTKKSLYKEIQQACCNALAAQERFYAGLDAQASAQESFDLVKAKYENGKATITEFNEARDGYLKATSDLVQARYEHLFITKLIDFYRGRPLVL